MAKRTQLWYGGQLSSTYLLLEKLSRIKGQNRVYSESDLARTKTKKDALRRLLSKKLIGRKQMRNPRTGRLVYRYKVTMLGKKTYQNMKRQWGREVKPKFIN